MERKWVSDELQVGHIWTTNLLHFLYNISHLVLQTYQSLTPSEPPVSLWTRKMNVGFDQSEESDPVVSLNYPFVRRHQLVFCTSGVLYFLEKLLVLLKPYLVVFVVFFSDTLYYIFINNPYCGSYVGWWKLENKISYNKFFDEQSLFKEFSES